MKNNDNGYVTSQMPQASVSKRGYLRTHWYENTNKTHFQDTKVFPGGLAQFKSENFCDSEMAHHDNARFLCFSVSVFLLFGWSGAC